MSLPTRKSFRSLISYFGACGSEIASPLLRASLLGIPPATPPKTWRKGLLVGANHIGDILYRMSSLGRLQNFLPDCEWHIIAPEPAAQVLIGNSAISKIHRFEIPTAKSSSEYEVLKNENYDVAICYDSGMYLRPLKLAVNLRIPNRVGYTHKGFSAWVTHRYPQPFPAYFRDLVAQITSKPSRGCLRPALFPSVRDEFQAKAFAADKGIGPDQPVVACFATSRQPSGMWPSDRFAETLAILENQRRDLYTILIGGPDDLSVLNQLKARFQLRAQVSAGELSLLALTCFLRRCRAVLTTDSGPRHLANAAGTNTVFFRNIAAHPTESGCYLPTESDLAPVMQCPTAVENQSLVFDSVTPEIAAAAVLSLL